MAESNCIGKCRTCGSHFEQKTGPGRRKLYCTPSCRPEVKRTPRPRKVIDRMCTIPGCGNRARSSVSPVCQSHYAKEWKDRRMAPLREARAKRPCATCGEPIGSGRATKYCGRECRDKGPVTRRIRRAVGRAYQASKRTDGVVQFDPIEVLERDKWTCQICGVKTPKSLRGLSAPRSPEVDHIIPLSKGGHHAPWNTQCLCRKCNRAKSDRAEGQLGLPLVA